MSPDERMCVTAPGECVPAPHIFLCPSCGGPLHESVARYVCERGHAFDRARSGYVNLSTSARRGDTLTMLHARRRFLENGFFEPLSNAINAGVSRHLERLRETARLTGHDVIVDAGCGEGYYLTRLGDRLRQDAAIGPLRLVGLDASKDAVRLTALRLAGHPCAVADISESLCVRRGAAAVLLNVFAPRNPRAFADTLLPGGLCLVVVPRPQHMASLRGRVGLLDVPPEKPARIEAQFEGVMRLVDAQEVDYPLTLDADAAEDWVRMGPNAWHLTPAQVSIVRQLEAIETHVACTLLSFVT